MYIVFSFSEVLGGFVSGVNRVDCPYLNTRRTSSDKLIQNGPKNILTELNIDQKKEPSDLPNAVRTQQPES